ncbi:mitochondrial carrier protein MTM1 isoform X2 [Benincasa hispida]|uniref:mitochondrial carrier protein MTM1 isoform X2 n=1 Tax=Benincasa hispida TaxID=102211 RepID=UPI0019022659|nr:mitochondrial carrier protein MTM1 isoform X2 [Benincasa hispida]
MNSLAERMLKSARGHDSWIGSEEEARRLERDGNDSSMLVVMSDEVRLSASPSHPSSDTASNVKLGFGERAFSAAGAAFLSAVIVNPLDVAKTRLQAQAAGVPYSHPLSDWTSRMAFFGPNTMFADLRCSPSCARAGIHGTVAICPPDCFQYKGTLDVFYKIIRQEGFARLWRGTNAGLALAVPTVGIYLPCYDIFRNWLEEITSQNRPGATPYVPLVAGALARSLACATCYPIELARTRMQAFKEMRIGKKPPGVWQTLLGVVSNVKSTTNGETASKSYRALWTGMGAQLARDVPFSAICWSTLEPVRRKLLGLVGDNANAASVFGANFSAGFVAGCLAAAATCPLDVAKTRRQIEKDPVRALRMTTRQTLMEVWRDGGMKGLFAGVAPRVGRAGPSVGIVVSFYEVVKYVLHRQYPTSAS